MVTTDVKKVAGIFLKVPTVIERMNTSNNNFKLNLPETSPALKVTYPA
jgi:hypothetical protein